jgi:hypothetical protein
MFDSFVLWVNFLVKIFIYKKKSILNKMDLVNMLDPSIWSLKIHPKSFR